MLEKITKYVDELIEGNDENLTNLNEILEEFFKDKTQKDFDKINKKILQQLVRLLDILKSNKSLTENDRALLDYVFHNKKPLKYFWIDEEQKLHAPRLKAFRDFLIKEIDFDKNKEDFIKWVDWIISDEIGWDDGTYENKEKDFMIGLDITNYESERPDLHIFMIGNKKYKEVMLDALGYFPKINNNQKS